MSDESQNLPSDDERLEDWVYDVVWAKEEHELQDEEEVRKEWRRRNAGEEKTEMM